MSGLRARSVSFSVSLAMGCAVALAGVAPQGVPTLWSQEDSWVELATDHFVIVHRPGDEPHGDYLRHNLEAVYAELVAVFGVELDPPVTVRLYPTLEDYLRANPLAIDVDGQIAHSARGRREIGIPLPRALERGDEGLGNYIRHDLAHLFVNRLADGRMPPGFQEGAAQYMERPDEERASGVARMREAWGRDALYTWSELAAPGAMYLDPPVSYPESLSVVHYLVHQHGFPSVVTFARAAANATGWRSALEAAYGQPPEQLEAAWRTWLPSYLDGGWRFHALYSRDLVPAEALLAQGDYEGAVAHLSSALSLLSHDDPALAEQARDLLDRAQSVLAARSELSEARGWLLAGDYQAALQSAEEARSVLADVGDGAGATTASEIGRRAALGLASRRDLERAASLPPWQVAQARVLADEATTGFAQLGNDLAAAQALDLREALDRRQAPAGWVLLILGGALLAWNLVRRTRDRMAESLGGNPDSWRARGRVRAGKDGRRRRDLCATASRTDAASTCADRAQPDMGFHTGSEAW